MGLLIIKVKKKAIKLFLNHILSLKFISKEKLKKKKKPCDPSPLLSLLYFYTSPLLKWEDISFPSFHLGHISTFIFVTDNSIYYPKWKKGRERNCSPSPLFFLTKLMNFNIIPFRYSEETFYIPSLLLWYLTNLLGSTNPERNALLQEPLSTSVENYNSSVF